MPAVGEDPAPITDFTDEYGATVLARFLGHLVVVKHAGVHELGWLNEITVDSVSLVDTRGAEVALMRAEVTELYACVRVQT